ncbi:Hypothetical_protein [Hexamita inflata]|nr:Hypothetical protein HINF_LOCUS37420 [Hexamita inflata]
MPSNRLVGVIYKLIFQIRRVFGVFLCNLTLCAVFGCYYDHRFHNEKLATFEPGTQPHKSANYTFHGSWTRQIASTSFSSLKSFFSTIQHHVLRFLSQMHHLTPVLGFLSVFLWASCSNRCQFQH